MYVNDLNPYDEVHNILEVLQRNSSGRNVKFISEDEATIQIEQKNVNDAITVVEELELRGYKRVGVLMPLMGGGWTIGIIKERSRGTRAKGGLEPGD